MRYMVLLSLIILTTELYANDIVAEPIGYALLKTFFALCAVLMMIWGAFYVLNKFKQSTQVNQKNDDLIIVQRLDLGVKEKLIMIKALNKKMLLSICAADIKVLHVFDETPTESPVSEPETTEEETFSKRLMEIVKSGKLSDQ